MKATVIVDNIGNEMACGEWGLCIYIEYEGKRILLDTGASDLFVKNAAVYDLPLEQVDVAALSHAHYDHADGMNAFFKVNSKAQFYLRDQASENCYFKKWFVKKYIGIPRGILEEQRDRIEKVSGDYLLFEGAWLIPHKADGLERIGRRENMYVKTSAGWKPDDFAHEQSLVLETEKGLVIFNCCSHGGADQIIREVQETFPEQKIAALIGGFHLFNKSEEEIHKLAKGILDTGIEQVYTGHCTGGKAYKVLQKDLGERLFQLKVGLEIEF